MPGRRARSVSRKARRLSVHQPSPQPEFAALFLHTGWRSAGTWIWSRCREQPGVRAYYEPLHERLATLRASDIAALRPGTWASRHSDTAPYFQEYGPHLRPGASGVPFYQRRFAFDRFFLAHDEPDAALEVYLQSLLSAGQPGQRHVLKFCRSLGRVGWMARRFPQALHVVLLRDPRSQFASAQALLTRERNRYFAIAPVMVLAGNAGHPLIRQACAALGVRPPALHSEDLAYVTETCWRHVRRSQPGERYRQFLAFWAATALAALDSGAPVLEAGRLTADAAYRAEMEAMLGRAVGSTLHLEPRHDLQAAGRSGPPMPPLAIQAAELNDIHLAASVLIRACGAGLGEDRLATLLKLLPADRLPARSPRNAITLPAPPPPLPAPMPPGLRRRAATLALVLSARALQPVRRAHGTMVRWQARLPRPRANQIT